jgi:hypothetical protein
MNHHDLFFKATFSIRENAADFVRHTLPTELVEQVDFETLAIEKGSHVDAALAENFSDIVYTGRFSGTQIKIALLFEHKSSPDNDLPFQLYRYIGNLWENSLKQKQPRLPVIPIVLYHGWQSWTPGSLITRFENLPNAMKPYIPDFQFIFVDLSAYTDESIKTIVFKVASLRVALPRSNPISWSNQLPTFQRKEGTWPCRPQKGSDRKASRKVSRKAVRKAGRKVTTKPWYLWSAMPEKMGCPKK